MGKSLERPYLTVRLHEFQGKFANAKIRYAGSGEANWYNVSLNRSSLEKLGLRPYDSFKWRPREDGMVLKEDICEHPRIADPGEIERTQKAFEDLEHMLNRLSK